MLRSMNELLNTAEAAERLGVTVRAVQKMIEAGTLAAGKVGRDYIIQVSDVENLSRRSVGRPPKTKAEDAPATTRTAKRAAKKGGKK